MSSTSVGSRFTVRQSIGMAETGAVCKSRFDSPGHPPAGAASAVRRRQEMRTSPLGPCAGAAVASVTSPGLGPLVTSTSSSSRVAVRLAQRDRGPRRLALAVLLGGDDQAQLPVDGCPVGHVKPARVGACVPVLANGRCHGEHQSNGTEADAQPVINSKQGPVEAEDPRDDPGHQQQPLSSSPSHSTSPARSCACH